MITYVNEIAVFIKNTIIDILYLCNFNQFQS